MKKLLLAQMVLGVFTLQCFAISNYEIDALVKNDNVQKIAEYCDKRNCYACEKLLMRYIAIGSATMVTDGLINFLSSSFLGIKAMNDSDNEAIQIADKLYEIGCSKYKCKNVCDLPNKLLQ